MIRHFVLTAALAAAAFAQGPRRPMMAGGGDPGALKNYLNLTDDQVTKLRSLNRDAMQHAKPDFQKMRDQARTLRQEMNAANPDPAAVGRATIEMQKLRKATQQSMEQARQSALSVLTDEQRTKLAALEQARQLQPAIGDAMRFHLLAPPAPPADGAGAGMQRFRAPFGPGPRF